MWFWRAAAWFPRLHFPSRGFKMTESIARQVHQPFNTLQTLVFPTGLVSPGGKNHVCLPHAQALRSHRNQRRPCLPTPRAVCCTLISLPMQRDGVHALTHGLHNQEGASGLLQMGFLNGGVALAKWVCLPFLFWIRRIIHHLHFPATHPAENEAPRFQITRTNPSNYAESNRVTVCLVVLSY